MLAGASFFNSDTQEDWKVLVASLTCSEWEASWMFLQLPRHIYLVLLCSPPCTLEEDECTFFVHSPAGLVHLVHSSRSWKGMAMGQKRVLKGPIGEGENEQKLSMTVVPTGHYFLNHSQMFVVQLPPLCNSLAARPSIGDTNANGIVASAASGSFV